MRTKFGGGTSKFSLNYAVIYPYNVAIIPASWIKKISVTRISSGRASIYLSLYTDNAKSGLITAKYTNDNEISFSQSELDSALATYPNATVFVFPDGGTDTISGTLDIEFRN